MNKLGKFNSRILNIINLNNSRFNSMGGVYIIYHRFTGTSFLRIGQSITRSQLAAHHNSPAIRAFSHLALFATRASVVGSFMDELEVFFTDTLNPIIGQCIAMHSNDTCEFIMIMFLMKTAISHILLNCSCT